MNQDDQTKHVRAIEMLEASIAQRAAAIVPDGRAEARYMEMLGDANILISLITNPLTRDKIAGICLEALALAVQVRRLDQFRDQVACDRWSGAYSRD